MRVRQPRNFKRLSRSGAKMHVPRLHQRALPSLRHHPTHFEHFTDYTPSIFVLKLLVTLISIILDVTSPLPARSDQKNL